MWDDWYYGWGVEFTEPVVFGVVAGMIVFVAIIALFVMLAQRERAG